MILSEKDKRDFSALLMKDFGTAMSPDDFMLPVLYMQHHSAQSIQSAVEELKKIVSENSGGSKLVFSTEAAAVKYAAEQNKFKKNIIEYCFMGIGIIVVVFFLTWFFLSIQKKYDYNIRVENMNKESTQKK